MGRGHPYPERPAPIDDPLEGLSFDEYRRALMATRGDRPITGDPAEGTESFEEWFVRSDEMGKRIKQQIISKLLPSDDEVETLDTFMAAVRQRMKNGNKS